jgi:hypothetical protein
MASKHDECPLSLESFTNCPNLGALLDPNGYCLQCEDLGNTTVRAAGHPSAQQGKTEFFEQEQSFLPLYFFSLFIV